MKTREDDDKDWKRRKTRDLELLEVKRRRASEGGDDDVECGGGRRRAKKLKYSRMTEYWGMEQEECETIGEDEEELVTTKEPVGGREEPVLRGEQKTPRNSVKGRGLSKSTSTPTLTSSPITDYFSSKRIMEHGADVNEEFPLDDLGRC